jgi:mRNA-degrading endonuclease toxin of MazEF toxin-antitoxin module
MRQWDVFMYPFDRERRHPAVIISNDEICDNDDIEEVNALLCTSARVNRGPKFTEQVLDESDGFDWKTMVRCDKIHLLSKARFTERMGRVTEECRPSIARKIVEVFRFPLGYR